MQQALQQLVLVLVLVFQQQEQQVGELEQQVHPQREQLAQAQYFQQHHLQ
jgi:hypothetical protein